MADLGSLSEVPKPARPKNFFCYLTSLEPKEPDKTFRFDSRGQGSTFKSKFLEKSTFSDFVRPYLGVPNQNFRLFSPVLGFSGVLNYPM